ncbi:MAG: DUF421 domain-containing protein, partial [Gammaproteobacteria bacterium]
MAWLDGIPDLIGTESAITWWQMTIRAVVVFVFGIVLVRIFGQRAFGRQTVLDVILAIVIGSNLSRTMTASAPLLPTLAATAGLVLLYWVFNHVAARWHRVSWLVKGGVIQLVDDGRMDRKAMRRSGISEGDIEEAMRRS